MPTHAERKPVPYTPEQIFDLVVDVERYPEFLPWCAAARVRQCNGSGEFVADLVIGYKMFRERFTSHVSAERPYRIDVSYSEGPFRYLNNHWVLEPRDGGGCIIDFYVDFEFRSRALQGIIRRLFNEAVRRMVNAFEKRAQALYGPGGHKPTS
ncbi:MAG: type II toxin-antitoxin system RatA family toxin [Rhodospirillales bacterium]|nr:type II toxin-antitoxin system RatA family toxin [Rhodospirillales bacterium]